MGDQRQLFSKAFMPLNEGDLPPPPPSSAPSVSGREAILLKMQLEIFKFYKKYHPEKLRKSVIAIAMQIWWDNGLIFVNHFLTEKYGNGLDLAQDFLDDFDRQGEDITVVSKHELNISAANKHLMVKAVVKANTGKYFNANKKVVVEEFTKRKNERMGLGGKPVTTLFKNVNAKDTSIPSWVRNANPQKLATDH